MSSSYKVVLCLFIFVIIAFTAECWALTSVAVQTVCTLSLLGLLGSRVFCTQLETKVPSVALRGCARLGVQACLLVHRSFQISPELWFFNLLISGPFLILEDYEGLHRSFCLLGL